LPSFRFFATNIQPFFQNNLSFKNSFLQACPLFQEASPEDNGAIIIESFHIISEKQKMPF